MSLLNEIPQLRDGWRIKLSLRIYSHLQLTLLSSVPKLRDGLTNHEISSHRQTLTITRNAAERLAGKRNE